MKKFRDVMSNVVLANKHELANVILGDPQFARIDLARLVRVGNAFVFASNASIFRDSLRSLEDGRLDGRLEKASSVPFLGREWSKLHPCSNVYSQKGGCGMISRALHMSFKCSSKVREALPLHLRDAVQINERDLHNLEKRWEASGFSKVVSLKKNPKRCLPSRLQTAWLTLTHCSTDLRVYPEPTIQPHT